MKGIVRKFSALKGHGFLETPDGRQVIVHADRFSPPVDFLPLGTEIEFSWVQTARGVAAERPRLLIPLDLTVVRGVRGTVFAYNERGFAHVDLTDEDLAKLTPPPKSRRLFVHAQEFPLEDDEEPMEGDQIVCDALYTPRDGRWRGIKASVTSRLRAEDFERRDDDTDEFDDED